VSVRERKEIQALLREIGRAVMLACFSVGAVGR
jgi:hypothetical protein